MWLQSLQLSHLRCVSQVQLAPVAGLNVLIGHNGAGKTSVLEAVSLLGSGRSFRGGAKTPVVQHGADALNIFACVQTNTGREHLGFSRSARGWQARVNGSDVATMTELVRRLPVVVLEPGSHEVVEGGSEARRKMLDWLLFHVEPDFSAQANRYQRVLKQRNAALKLDGADAASLAVWDQAIVTAGQAIADMRAALWARLEPGFRIALQSMLPELGAVQLQYQQGWPEEQSLLEAQRLRHAIDLGRGFSSRGPHRADWGVQFARAQDKTWLSRGQEKCVFIAFALALLAEFAEQRGEKAILCIDDLFSELDSAHQQRCFEQIESQVDQLWISGTESRSSIAAWRGEKALFHVEQGTVRRADF
jgi:DNA replication and repair protein RecF